MKHSLSASVSRRARGFTLIELMITCVILAIIVGVAVPSYQSSVRKSRRAEARNAILDLAGREERFLSVNNAYSALPTDLGYTGTVWTTVTTSSGYYQLQVQSPDPAYTGPNTSPSYIITATATGIQASDTVCTVFTATQIGIQKALTSGAVDNTTTCWGN